MRRSWWSAGVLAVLLLAAVVLDHRGTRAQGASQDQRNQAARLVQDGNYAEALPLYRALLENPDSSGAAAGSPSTVT